MCTRSHRKIRPENKYKTWKNSQRLENTHTKSLTYRKTASHVVLSLLSLRGGLLQTLVTPCIPLRWRPRLSTTAEPPSFPASVRQSDLLVWPRVSDRRGLSLVIMRKSEAPRFFMGGEVSHSKNAGSHNGGPLIARTDKAGRRTPPWGPSICQTRRFERHLGFLCFKGEKKKKNLKNGNGSIYQGGRIPERADMGGWWKSAWSSNSEEAS